MAGMVRTRAQVAGIGPIVLEQGKARALEKGVQFGEVVLAPAALQAGRVAEGGRGTLRGNDIVFRVDAPGSEQGIAPDFNTFRAGIFRVSRHLLQVGVPVILDVEAAAEGEDDHLKADYGALVYGVLHGFPIGEPRVQH